jgi:hypothetical protein
VWPIRIENQRDASGATVKEMIVRNELFPRESDFLDAPADWVEKQDNEQRGVDLYPLPPNSLAYRSDLPEDGGLFEAGTSGMAPGVLGKLLAST